LLFRKIVLRFNPLFQASGDVSTTNELSGYKSTTFPDTPLTSSAK